MNFDAAEMTLFLLVARSPLVKALHGINATRLMSAVPWWGPVDIDIVKRSLHNLLRWQSNTWMSPG